MKLELKHLAPYLPYGLIFHHEIIQKNLTMIGCEFTHELRIRLTDGLYAYDVCKLKPILRPLLELETNMEDGHEYIELLNAMYGDSVTDFNFIGNRLVEHTSKDKGITFDRIEYTNRTMPYYIMEFLFQYHFDIFELIPQGLAVDINTLEK